MDQLASDQTLPRTSTSAKGVSALPAAILFFVFPPVGVYLLWKDKDLHYLFAVLTALLGFFNILTAASLYFSYDRILEFLNQTTYEVPPNWDKLALILLFFSIYQTFSCLVLVREAKKNGYLNTVRLLYLVGMLVIDFVVVPLVLGAVAIEFFNSYLAKYKEQFDSTTFETY